jgi:hypothetical protein
MKKWDQTGQEKKQRHVQQERDEVNDFVHPEPLEAEIEVRKYPRTNHRRLQPLSSLNKLSGPLLD